MRPLRVFISYRRDDSPEMTGRIRDRMVQEFGADSVFLDVESVSPSTVFRESLREAVLACDVMLVVIGRNWLQPIGDDQIDWLETEVEMGLRSSEIAVLPVLVRDMSMPTSSELPTALTGLTYVQAARIRNDPDFHSDVSLMLARPPFVEPSGPDSSGAAEWRSKVLLAAIVAGVIAALVALLVIVTRLDDDDAHQEPTAPTVTSATSDVATPATLSTTSASTTVSEAIENQELQVQIIEDSFTTQVDRARRENSGVEPDGDTDLGFAVDLIGGPTGLVVSACDNAANLSLDQWDTYTGEQPLIDPPFPGWGDRDEPTYQLAVVRDGTVLNPSVNLTGSLADGTYWLYLPLFDTPTRTSGICVTAIRDGVSDSGPVDTTRYVAYSYPPGSG